MKIRPINAKLIKILNNDPIKPKDENALTIDN